MENGNGSRDQPRINPELEKVGQKRLGRIEKIKVFLESKEAPSARRRIVEGAIGSVIASGVIVAVTWCVAKLAS